MRRSTTACVAFRARANTGAKTPHRECEVLGDMQAAAAILLPSQRTDVANAIENFNSETRSEFPADTDTLRVCADIFVGAKTAQKRAQNVRAHCSCAPLGAAK
jgi:hypothetical protein